MTIKNKKIIPSSYGSIPHLSTSKLFQKADKKITLGQELLLTKKARDWRDLIIVTEKLDGSNVGIIKKDGLLVPIIRSGYPAVSSHYGQHILFHNYVYHNYEKFSFLPEGWRISGEWLIQVHGTFYDISKEQPFVAFDIFNEDNKRLSYINFINTCSKFNIQTTPLVHIGHPISIEHSLKILNKGLYGKSDKPEGIVYRMERDKQFDFIAKWVRSDKEDGKYLSEVIYNKGYDKI